MKYKCLLNTGNKLNWDKAVTIEVDYSSIPETEIKYVAEKYIKDIENTQNEELCDSSESVEVVVLDELGIEHNFEVFGEYTKSYKAVGVWH